ncbi:hypothetical protein BGZ46_008877 [Entomortierella lignicola]|nr:hypothetical protein BGZ46_008877 [Entomortierella lignicola]
MTTLLFQLVRVRRSSASPSSATTFAAISSSAPSWSLEVPETVRAVVENFADPVEVVSYVGCNRSTQDALWAAAVAEHSNYHHRTSNDDTIVSGRIGGPAVPPEFNGPNQGGIWAWLSPRKSSYNTGGSKIGTGTGTGTTETTSEFNPVVNTLYLINRDDELLKDAEEFQLEYRPYTLDNVLVPLLALCSTRMNIVSITTRDTKADLSHLGRSLSVLTTKPQQQQQQQQQQQCVSSSELADLSWHWCGSTSDFTYDPLSSTNNSHDYTDSGISTLKQIIAKLEKTAGNEVSEHLSVLQKCFKDVQCHLPSSASQGTSNNDNNNDNNGNQLDYPAQEDQQQDIDYILTHELKDLSITEANTSSIFDENLWFRKLLDSDGDTNQDMFLNPRLINGK